MSTRALLRPLAIVSVVAVAAAVGLPGPVPAHATHAGIAGELTIADGSRTIQGSPDITLPYRVDQVAWSPDGSRGVFVTEDGGIATVRWNDGTNVRPLVDPDKDPTAQRRDALWLGDGDRVIWAERTVGGPWRLEQSVSAHGYPTQQISPDDGMHYLNPDTNGSYRIAVQRQADSAGSLAGVPEVGILDPVTGYSRILTDASDPSLSPDGTRVAFVRSDGTHRQIWVSDLTGGNLAQITTAPMDHTEPTWDPSGYWIAFRQADVVGQVYVATRHPLVGSHTGRPAYQPYRRDRVDRLAGNDRHATAVAVSQSAWATVGSADSPQPSASAVVLARSDTFADGLGGSALAAVKGGPLLLTPPTSLNPGVKTEIQRILKPGSTVYLLGSTGALSQAVQDQIETLGFRTVRLAGPDRFSTSIAIANAIDPTPDRVLAATGMNFPDALAAGAAAGASIKQAQKSAVVVLTNDARLPAATKAYLDALPSTTKIFGIGTQGRDATRAYGSTPVAGWNRYQTAALIARGFFGGENHAGLATGDNWPDALSGGALMGSLGGPLLLSPGTRTEIGTEAAQVLDESSGSIHTGLIFGSDAVIWSEQQRQAAYWLSGTHGYQCTPNFYCS